ncbi:F-box/LRR-repeat protein 6 [Hyperolius riggenbachi]|uniref:F-box/LRR-repeat protein 6 n=1 Tax=Hyperolius riggenbachi TaxID=752182 RepID=UPI0035A2EBB2
MSTTARKKRSTQRGRSTKRSKERLRSKQPTSSYYIHHTDKDMLLLIPSNRDLDETETVCIRKRCRVPEPLAKESRTDFGWGSIIPVEILHRVFQLLSEGDGAVPVMCRLSQVCRLWREVASSPDLWRSVTVSRCWSLPGAKDPPRVQKKVTQTMEALIQQRLPQVSDFTLHHWKNHVTFVLKCLSESCPLLDSLSLLHCSQVMLEDLLSVGQGCPQLQSLNLQNSKVLRLLNIFWQTRPLPRDSVDAPGFPELQELCLGTCGHSSVNDGVLQRLLRGSSKLRVLDLRGCQRITPRGLWDLPCTDLEHIFLGLYCSSSITPSLQSGLHLLISKWHHSLQELDLASQIYEDDDLEKALSYFSQGGTNNLLSSLNLSGTRVTSNTVRGILLNCKALTHFDLASCRNLPRRLKRVYRGREEMAQCLDDITKALQEMEDQ